MNERGCVLRQLCFTKKGIGGRLGLGSLFLDIVSGIKADKDEKGSDKKETGKEKEEKQDFTSCSCGKTDRQRQRQRERINQLFGGGEDLFQIHLFLVLGHYLLANGS